MLPKIVIVVGPGIIRTIQPQNEKKPKAIGKQQIMVRTFCQNRYRLSPFGYSPGRVGTIRQVYRFGTARPAFPTLSDADEARGPLSILIPINIFEQTEIRIYTKLYIIA